MRRRGNMKIYKYNKQGYWDITVSEVVGVYPTLTRKETKTREEMTDADISLRDRIRSINNY